MASKSPTPNGRAIENHFRVLQPEILHEHYSCTVDFGRELSKPYITQLERKGFDVTREESGIYTLQR